MSTIFFKEATQGNFCLASYKISIFLYFFSLQIEAVRGVEASFVFYLPLA